MPLAAVLAIGVDLPFLASHPPVWQSVGYNITSAGSIREAIVQLKRGNFDLILLDHSIPIESRERLTFLIRASGAGIPVVSVTDSPGHTDSFADATIRNEPQNLLKVIAELLAKRASTQAAVQPYEAR